MIIDGKAVAQRVTDEVRSGVAAFVAGDRCGSDPDSEAAAPRQAGVAPADRGHQRSAAAGRAPRQAHAEQHRTGREQRASDHAAGDGERVAGAPTVELRTTGRDVVGGDAVEIVGRAAHAEVIPLINCPASLNNQFSTLDIGFINLSR